MKDLKRASARGIAWNLLQNVASRILALVVVAVLSRILDKSAFGAVALALTIMSLADLFVDQGFAGFITQTPTLDDKHLDTAFWFNVGTAAAFTAILAAGAQPLAACFGEPTAAPIIQWLSLSVLVRSFGIIPAAVLVRELKFRALSMRTLAAAVIGGAAGIIAALSDLGVYSLVIQVVVGDFVATAILWRASHWRPGRRVSRQAFRQLVGFGMPVIGATMLALVSRRLDNLIVGAALGLTMLGVYSMAQRVYQIALQVVNKSTTEVAFSALSRLGDSDERRRHAFYRMIELTGVLCFPTYVGLALVAEPLTVTLFGWAWHDSAPVLVLFALSGVPFSLTTIHNSAIKSTGRTRPLLWINSILLVVYLPPALVLVERGPAAAAAASLISCVAILPVEIWLMRRALSVRVVDYLKSLRGPTLATLIMTGCTLGVLDVLAEQPMLGRLFAGSAIGVLTYVLALRIVAPSTFRRCIELAGSTFRKSPSSPDSDPE